MIELMDSFMPGEVFPEDRFVFAQERNVFAQPQIIQLEEPPEDIIPEGDEEDDDS